MGEHPDTHRRGRRAPERGPYNGLRALPFWLVMGAACGAVAGLCSAVLSLGAGLAMRAYGSVPWASALLPLLCLATFGLYRVLRVDWGASTNAVIACARGGRGVRGTLAPAILCGTLLTLLGGGSVGKEAAALQAGGAAASSLGALLGRAGGGLAWVARRPGWVVRMGMAGAFAALMGAPVSAALFVAEVTCAPLRAQELLSTVAASLCGYLVSVAMGVRPPWVALTTGGPAAVSVEAAAAVACAAVFAALLFCLALRVLRSVIDSASAPDWLRALTGACLVAAVTLALGPWAQTGTGEGLMEAAFLGQAPDWAFACKIGLTLLALSFGVKGGEIMPVMAIGAALGCQLGSVIGVDPSACAGVGLVAMLAACTNAPLAAAALGIEAFGPSLAAPFVVACVVAYALTFYTGLYPANYAPTVRALGLSLRLRLHGWESRPALCEHYASRAARSRVAAPDSDDHPVL